MKMLEHSRQKNLLISYVRVSNLCCYMQRNQIIGQESLGWQENRKPLGLENRKTGMGQPVETITQVPSRRRIQQKKRKNLGTWLTKSIGHKR